MKIGVPNLLNLQSGAGSRGNYHVVIVAITAGISLRRGSHRLDEDRKRPPLIASGGKPQVKLGAGNDLADSIAIMVLQFGVGGGMLFPDGVDSYLGIELAEQGHQTEHSRRVRRQVRFLD